MALTGWSRAQEPAPSEPPVPMELIRAGGDHLVRHTGKYEPLQLRWVLHSQVADVLAVFPHPQIAAHIYLATQGGLLKSTDGGLTFAPLPAGSAERIGTVTSLAFRADMPQRILIASRERGLFITSDGGATIERLADKSSGLASDAVMHVYYADDDPQRRTIVAVHGAEATGVSRSPNGGRTWEVLHADQHVHQLAWPRGRQVLIEASPPDDVDTHTVYHAATLDAPWQKLIGDVFITGIAGTMTPRDDAVFLATAGQGMFRVAREGGMVVPLLPAGQREWSSLGVTFGPHADSELFYAYHPRELGMVLFTERQLRDAVTEEARRAVPAEGEEEAPSAPEEDASSEPPYRTLSDGLFTGPIVLEGAHIRAGANGNTFFAVVNRTLYRSVRTPAGLAVMEVTVEPPTLSVEPGRIKDAADALLGDVQTFARSHGAYAAAAELRPRLAEQRKVLDTRAATIAARVHAPATDPPVSVTAELSRLGLSPLSPLYDDGLHGDGAAGDGVWANRFTVDFATIRPRNGDWRPRMPGPLGVTVTAAGESGTLAGAVGTLALYTRRDTLPFLSNARPKRISGPVEGNMIRLRGVSESVRLIAITGSGEWSASMSDWVRYSIDQEQVLSFYIRSSRPTSDPLFVQLRDSPEHSQPTITPPIDLMAEGFIAGKRITPDEQRVLIPVSRLLQGAEGFEPWSVTAMIFSGKASAAVDIMIRGLRLVPAEQFETDGEEGQGQ